ncbi:SMP-30/gluconolactonase/LRE family protein [Marinobacterium rhizophilum]|uniref:SMP-30/gluconolactonase/LRE family protein n=1 Tax=Marinobacterium rhizophilum TaxID=420402 RepID=UPI002101FFC2|nr:SMP-30/gluconolactonase/LRE family protein [Marinobacterium rhizophilum]
MAVTIVDSRSCLLGEGPLWHPERQQLFWFDIIGKTLLTRPKSGEEQEWSFDEYVSAAGWVDGDSLLIAGETGLFQFDLQSGNRQPVCKLEADNSVTRSNDGRADPWGGFWIGTMGRNAEPDAGAIYRYYRGELRRLFAPITISNAICFSPDRRYGYFADTARRIIWRQTLESRNGWPAGELEVFLDCRKKGLNPDGAVVDSVGRLWNAQWGASRIACYDADGSFVSAITFPAEQISCPAFGGIKLDRLYATSATEGLSGERLKQLPTAGQTFAIDTNVQGQAEYRVLL